jgi:hypothetical protein
MSHFKPGQMSIKEEDGKGSAIRVVKLETGGAPQVKDFAFNHLKQAGKGDYNVIKAKYGSLAEPTKNAAEDRLAIVTSASILCFVIPWLLNTKSCA